MPVPSETEAFDFIGSPPPSKFYLVASTPRSGSTLLTRLLWQSGRMGAPHEYFNLQTVLFRMQMRFRSDSIHAYTDELLRRRTGPNGVFGLKLHHEHWHTFWFCGRFYVFKDMRYIRIRRRDRLGQAISLAIARQTGQWTSDVPPRGPANYSFAEVRRALRDLELNERGWDQLFAERKIRPLELLYEDFRNEPERYVREVCRFVGVDPDSPAKAVALPDLVRQTSRLNQVWAERYRRDWQQRQAERTAAGQPPAS